jgi:hypothetical protein
MSRRSRTLTRALALPVALLFMIGGNAVADAPVGHSGITGAHSLTDSAEAAGARCYYNDDLNVDRISVMPPTMFARNRTSGRDRQWVGWRIELRYQPLGGSWRTLKTTDVVRVKAWDDIPAPLRRTTVAVTHPVGSGAYQVIVRMTWYRPGTSTVWQGTARHAVEHYTYPLAPPASASECPAGIL